MRTVIFIGVLLMSFATHADTLKDKDAAKALANAVMDQVGRTQTAEALGMLKPYLVIPSSEFEVMIEQMKLQMPMIEQRFGRTLGVELVGTEEVGESLMLITYIQKFEKHVMRWKFYFYKPNKEWVLNTFFTDDKIQTIFAK